MAEILKMINELHKDKCPRHCVITKEMNCKECLSYEYCISECLTLLCWKCKDEDICKSTIKFNNICRFIA